MSRARNILVPILLLSLAFVAFPFARHAWEQGIDGLGGNVSRENRFFDPDAWFSSAALFFHMLTGGLLTAAVPLQLLPVVRRRFPALHRAAGYVLTSAALFAALGGLSYIAVRGTIGGPLMSFAFSLYGLLTLTAALQTVRFARERAYARHRRWALRLFVLAMGSWLYRVHYGFWFAATGGLASNDDFTGLFDQVTLFAFYLPYLVILEAILRRRDNTHVPV